MEKKLINLRIEEELLNDLKKIAKKKGKNVTYICKNLMKDYIKKNEYLLINTKEEKFTIFTDIEKEFKNYTVILTKEDLLKIKDMVLEMKFYGNNEISFKKEFENAKPSFIINKLLKELYPHLDLQAMKIGNGLFQVVEDGKYLCEKFNAFVFDKNDNLIEGTAFDLATIKSVIENKG